MRSTWDPSKDATNQRKHGISFATAARVFRDPLHSSIRDRIVDGEERWQTVGYIEAIGLVLVAHTFWEEDGIENVRIISARRANRHERFRHQEG